MTARNAAIAKVKIAQKELGLDEAAYRAMLARVTGRDSAAKCTDAQLGLVLEELKARGWKPRVVKGGRTGAPARRPASSPMARKARALWISLHRLGVVRDASESALEKFGARQLGVERLVWADQSQAYRLIEALKAMAERAGWSQDVAGVPGHMQAAVLKSRLDALLASKAGGEA